MQPSSEEAAEEHGVGGCCTRVGATCGLQVAGVAAVRHPPASVWLW